jgi:UPF0755 protein
VKKIFLIFIPLFVFFVLHFYFDWFGPPGKSAETKVFVVPVDQSQFDVAKSLESQHFVQNADFFAFLLDNFSKISGVQSGGYRLSSNMNAWAVMKKITGSPDLKWVTISFCARKEQIGEKLAQVLEWNASQLDEWDNLYSDTSDEYFEGVYYPDTYLLPIDETPAQIAERFIDNFNSKFASYGKEALAKNIKWTTVLKIASLIGREAAGKKDMGLISGIIWNRLDSGMPLQIDATMSYTLGKNINGSWWGTIDIAQKRSSSPYNTYKYKGLPPTPICSPNTDMIAAAINPESTDCLYYLHDPAGEIHCAKTYAQHLQNIKTYLR